MNFDIYLHDTSHTCNGSHWIVGVLKKLAPLEEIVFLLKFFHFLSINRKWISSTFINQLIVLSRSVGFQNVSSYWFLYSNKILQWIPLGFVLFVMLTWPGRNRDGSSKQFIEPSYLHIQQLLQLCRPVWGGKNTALQTFFWILENNSVSDLCHHLGPILRRLQKHMQEGFDRIKLHTVKQLFVQNGTIWQFSERLCQGFDCQINMHKLPVDHDLLFWTNCPGEFCVLPSELKWNWRCLTSSHLTLTVQMLFVSLFAHSAPTVGFKVLRNANFHLLFKWWIRFFFTAPRGAVRYFGKNTFVWKATGMIILVWFLFSLTLNNYLFSFA